MAIPEKDKATAHDWVPECGAGWGPLPDPIQPRALNDKRPVECATGTGPVREPDRARPEQNQDSERSPLEDHGFGTSPRQVLHEVVVVDAIRTPFGRKSKPFGKEDAEAMLRDGAMLFDKIGLRGPKRVFANLALRYQAFKIRRAKPQKGSLHDLSPQDLAAESIKSLLKRMGETFDPRLIEDIRLGCVTQINGQGANIARFSALAADLPIEIPGVTVNRLCGSGLQAINDVTAQIASGNIDVAIAGGVEHMNNAKMASDVDIDSFSNRLPVPKDHTQLIAADKIAERYGFTREDLAQLAFESQDKYRKAREAGKYDNSIVPVVFEAEGSRAVELDHDEHPRPSSYDKIARLRPSIPQLGNKTVTAANASGIVDGSSVALLMSREKAEELGLKPRARIVTSAVVGSDPYLMLTGPIYSTQKALEKAGLTVKDIDRWEINEAFASVVLAVMQELSIDPEKVNVWGGAMAHGHPLGATGAALLGKVIDQLEDEGLRYGCVTLCIGGGQGITTIVERVSK